jgi:hypothetical protein
VFSLPTDSVAEKTAEARPRIRLVDIDSGSNDWVILTHAHARSLGGGGHGRITPLPLHDARDTTPPPPPQRGDSLHVRRAASEMKEKKRENVDEEGGGGGGVLGGVI